MKVKLLFIFALLLTVATGAWAQGPTWLRDGDTWDDATKTLTVKSNPVVGAYREIAEIEIVIFDTSVTSIGTNAFDGCTGLTDITIPDGVTTIGSDAFISCTNVQTISIGSGVTSIGFNPFSGCTKLATITVAAGNTYYDSRNSCNAIIEKTSNKLVVGCKNTTIPNTVTSIGQQAFEGCTDLASITIPSGVTSIGIFAFLNSGLTSIDIPASVVSIGNYAFSGCSSLTTGSLNGPATIGSDAFPTNANTTVTIASGLYLYNGTEVLSGDVTDMSKLNGKTLRVAIPYIDADGNTAYCTNFTVLDNTMTTLPAGWYVVNSDITYTGTVTLAGDVNIILADGKTMSVGTEQEPISGDGIVSELDNYTLPLYALTIYGQSTEGNNVGALKAYSSGDNHPAVYVENYTQYGGDVTATGDYGIETYSDVTIYGGTATVTGSTSAIVGIRFTMSGGNLDVTGDISGGDFTMSGGTATFTGNILVSSKVTFSGGNLTVNENISAAEGTINLGWSNASDRIYASWYDSTVKIAAGKRLVYTDGNNVSHIFGGDNMTILTTDEKTDIAGKTLTPAIPYIKNGTTEYCTNYTVLDNTMTTLPAGWYVVNSDVAYTGTVTLNGDAHLILADGKTMNVGTANDRIASGNCINAGTEYSLTIYGQTLQTGILNAFNSDKQAVYLKNYTQHGGNVTIDATKKDAIRLYGNDLTLTRGTLNVNASDTEAAISFYNTNTSFATVSGGNLTASGGYGINGNLNMIGGNVSAISSTNDFAIYKSATISSGTLTATGDINGNVTFTGGTATINGNIWSNATLGWTNADDRITASSYYGTVTIVEGKSMSDGTTTYNSGDLNDDQKAAIAGKTLQPAVKITLPTGVTASGTNVFNQTDGTYALPNATATIATATGYTISDVSATGANLTDNGDGTYTLTVGTTDVTVTATVTAKTYTVTLDRQGATTGSESATATYDADMPAITLPTRTGYDFVGYFTETDGGGTQYYNADGTSTRPWDIDAATTLYAKWETISIVEDGITYKWTSGTNVKVTECNNSWTSITIPASVVHNGETYDVTEIGEEAFMGNTSLTAIDMSTYNCPITIIHTRAFKNCTDLSSILLPASLTTIEDEAFSGCDLTEITIPASVEYLSENAFENCNEDLIIYVPKDEVSSCRNKWPAYAAIIHAEGAIPYIAADGSKVYCEEYTVLTDAETELDASWYVVNSDVTVNSRIDLTGDTNLILGDDYTLDVKGIYIPQSSTLTIYAQSDGMTAGKIVSHPTSGAAIGGKPESDNGNIVIHGGNIEATGGEHCAGIGSANGRTGGTITIYGGTVTAKGGTDAAAIGGGRNCDGGTIAIYGGTITANGLDDLDTNENGAGIGGGDEGDGGTITIYGGTITTYSRDGAGIGGGDGGDGGIITINGSTITSTKVNQGNGARIGGGLDAGPGTIIINGGKITAVGGSGAGIGGGKGNLANGTVTINGGVIDASGLYGIGEGENGGDVAITLSWTEATKDAISITSSSFVGTVTLANKFYNANGVFDEGEQTALSLLAGSALRAYDQLTLSDGADNSAAIAAANGKVYNVKLSGRTLYKDGYWNTLCLPFSLGNSSAEEGHYFDGTLLAGATVKELDGSTSNLNSEGLLTLNFSDATSIEAGKPYIVKWQKAADYDADPTAYDIVNPVFSNVTVDKINNDVDFSGGTFMGNYKPLEITVTGDNPNRNDYVVLAVGTKGNMLGYVNTNRTLGAFHAYFYIPANGGNPGASSFVLNADNESTQTGIGHTEITEITEKADAIYDLQGRRVENPKKGLYIVNGRKVVIK